MKAAVVLNENLPQGYLLNAAACITSGLFNQTQNVLGEKIEGNNISFIPITKIPILILRQNKKPWDELLERAKKNKLKYMLFTKEAQSTTSYEEYRERVTNKSLNEVEVVGIGVIGEQKLITKFAGDLALLR